MIGTMIQKLTMPQPGPVVIPPTDEIMQELQELERVEYRRLHGKLKLSIRLDPPKTTINDLFLAWMQENKHEVYVLGEVERFLDRQVKIEQRQFRKTEGNRYRELEWVWKLLRKADNHNVPHWGKYKSDSYTKPIPLPVLHLVEKIDDAFPGKASFYVSDYAMKDPDPFLVVLMHENGFVWQTCIAHWDEPAFKGKAKK